MKLFKILLFLLILPTQTLFSSTYLMDPMPNKKLAPDFVLAGLDGKEHSLTELRGKFALVNFWATWCTPCKAEMPTLESIHNTLKNDAFAAQILLFISLL